MKSVLIRADGSRKIGMGHLTRDIEIAKALQKRDYNVVFLTKNYSEGISLLNEIKIDYIELKKDKIQMDESIKEINDLINSQKKIFDIIIIDLQKYYDNKQYLDNLKKHCKNLIIICDSTEPFYIDANVIFVISQVQDLYDHRKYGKTKYFIGFKYYPLKNVYQKADMKQINKEVLNVLVTFGGSDPSNYSYRLIKSLKTTNINAKITLIIGSGYPKKKYEDIRKDKAGNIILKRNISNMFEFFHETDLCICSAGNTLIEVLTCGVPAIILPQTKLENERAIIFAKKDMIINMGLNFSDKELIAEVKEIMPDYSKRKIFSRNAQEYFDGKGTKRIIDIIMRI